MQILEISCKFWKSQIRNQRLSQPESSSRMATIHTSSLPLVSCQFPPNFLAWHSTFFFMLSNNPVNWFFISFGQALRTNFVGDSGKPDLSSTLSHCFKAPRRAPAVVQFLDEVAFLGTRPDAPRNRHPRSRNVHQGRCEAWCLAPGREEKKLFCRSWCPVPGAEPQ